jgi:hypothetical protein
MEKKIGSGIRDGEKSDPGSGVGTCGTDKYFCVGTGCGKLSGRGAHQCDVHLHARVSQVGGTVPFTYY